MKALNNFGWMLAGMLIGTGSYYCYTEYACKGNLKENIKSTVKKAEKKLDEVLEK